MEFDNHVITEEGFAIKFNDGTYADWSSTDGFVYKIESVPISKCRTLPGPMISNMHLRAHLAMFLDRRGDEGLTLTRVIRTTNVATTEQDSDGVPMALFD